ncbi:MAG: pilus assembly protein [Acidobacteria bacterium]|nr:pilus assembly protein [Acidobacteriota bacterium]
MAHRRYNGSTRHARSRGAIMVEAALTIIVFLMILFGIIDFGRMIWAYSTVAHATREAARYAMVHGSTSAAPAGSAQVAGVVRSQLLALDGSKVQVSVEWIASNPPPVTGIANRPGDTVAIRSDYPFSTLLPYMPAGALHLKSSSRMMIHH